MKPHRPNWSCWSRFLQRDELKVICRQHGLPDDGRARFELARRVLVGAGAGEAALAPTFAAETEQRDLQRQAT